jgi:hypothetical protein
VFYEAGSSENLCFNRERQGTDHSLLKSKDVPSLTGRKTRKKCYKVTC